jgi:16S rRNA (cytidine1402-2'-O)-methyltransferase
MEKKKGKLYLIPITLGEDTLETIPQYVIDRIHQLDTFIVERARTARRFISPTRPPMPIQEMTFHELDKRNGRNGISNFLKDAQNGKDIGLMSEAGCPGVADPGAIVVEMAYERGIEVIPMVGPSSILLALMASGMNGQQFSFHGYLSVKKPEKLKELKELEIESRQKRQTQIFIETPYRNDGLFEDMIQTLANPTKICIACDLTLPTEFILSQNVAAWKKAERPDLGKRPAVFLIAAY